MRVSAMFCIGFVKTILFGLKAKRQGVDAVARSLFAGSIVEHVPEMRIAARAANLGAQHSVTTILQQADARQLLRAGKTRPPAMRFEFRVGGEERGTAAAAEVASIGIDGEQRAAKRALRAGLTQDVVALGTEKGTPFGVATVNFR